MIETVDWIHVAHNMDPRRARKFIDQLSDEKLLKKDSSSNLDRALKLLICIREVPSWRDSDYPD
jgi:hypothetical protein